MFASRHSFPQIVRSLLWLLLRIDSADVFMNLNEQNFQFNDLIGNILSLSAAANNVENGDKESRAIHTFHKGQRLSRKLKRRITQRTILEARALKKHSKEAIHILIYAAELVCWQFRRHLY